jgi:porin
MSMADYETGTIDQGKLHVILTVDLEKLSGWEDLTFFANVFQIHNTGRLRRDCVGGINTIAATKALATTRLSELWFEQRFANDKASQKIGQLTADSECFFSNLSQIVLAKRLANHRRSELAQRGRGISLIRLEVNPVRDVWLRVAMLNGDPAGPGIGDEQLRNLYGLNFRLQDPPFFIGEAEFQHNYGKKNQGLATRGAVGGSGPYRNVQRPALWRMARC